jgi:hypothetical protein
LESFFQDPNQRFTRNIPTFSEIAKGARVEHRLDLNGGNWCGFGHCAGYSECGFRGRRVRFESGDLIIVTYDVPRTREADKMGVWYGVVAVLTTVP